MRGDYATFHGEKSREQCGANEWKTPDSGEHEDDRSLVFLEPVHDLIKNFGATEKRLSVGVFRSIQQALLHAMRLKVSDNTLGWDEARSSSRKVVTNTRVHNEIFATKHKHQLRWIFGMRDLFIPERVGGPIKMAVEEVRDTNFRTNKVIHQHI